MSRYHINPETGNPGICKAVVKCRFGDLETDHYESKEEARVAYEKRFSLEENLKKTPISKNDGLTNYIQFVEENQLQKARERVFKWDKKYSEEIKLRGYVSKETAEAYSKAEDNLSNVYSKVDLLKEERSQLVNNAIDSLEGESKNLRNKSSSGVYTGGTSLDLLNASREINTILETFPKLDENNNFDNTKISEISSSLEKISDRLTFRAMNDEYESEAYLQAADRIENILYAINELSR